MKTTIIILIILAAVGSALTGGCSLFSRKLTKNETIKRSVSASNRKKVKVENVNGNIYVNRDTLLSNEIKISYTLQSTVKKKDQDKPINDLSVDIDTTGEIVSLKGNFEREHKGIFNVGHTRQIDFHLTIPPGIAIDLEGVNGIISVDGIEKDIRIDLTNGEVSFNKTPGFIECSLVNGHISGHLDSTNGAKIDITNGDISLFLAGGVKGLVKAETVNGKISYENLSFTDLNKEKKTLSGRLGLSGNRIILESVNGKIKLYGTSQVI
jgi:DUF4097 and DUF4098 domain-containing protein YvlB